MKTTMIDIYEAAGGEANYDRTEVAINPAKMKPFEIKLRVFPTAINMNDGQQSIVFGVLLDDTVSFQEGPLGPMALHRQWEAEIELPVEQVQILKVAER